MSAERELARTPADELAERWTAAWSGAGFEACCTPDVTYEDPIVVRPLQTLEALEAHAAVLRQAVPDLRVELTSPGMTRGDCACIPWRMLGTHLGEVAMLPATEREIDLHGLHYLALADGQVRRARGFFDLYDAAIQLGLLPARGGLGEAALLLLRGFGIRR